MSRNKDRLGMGFPQPQNIPAPPPQTQSGGDGFSFVVPTEFVELPSRGRFYPPPHPLHNKETIEIKQMTAREEDMLTSRSLLKKGIALDRVIESVIIDKNINPDQMLVGDRNALIVAMRVSGYGSDYDTQVTCPACGTQQQYNFNLNDIEFFNGREEYGSQIVNLNDGTFSTELPVTKVKIVYRLLTGDDEKRVFRHIENARKRKLDENLITSQLRSIVVSVNGDEDPQNINYMIQNMPSRDSRHLRLMYKITAPNVDMHQDFSCSSCDHEQELEVPLTADFFWPDR